MQIALISIGAFAFIYTPYIGQEIILPIIYATIIAILLNPVVKFLEKLKVNKIIAISLAVLLVIIVTAALIYFASIQLSLFSETYPKLKEKFDETSVQVIRWVSQTFNIRVVKINAWITEYAKRCN